MHIFMTVICLVNIITYYIYLVGTNTTRYACNVTIVYNYNKYNVINVLHYKCIMMHTSLQLKLCTHLYPRVSYSIL